MIVWAGTANNILPMTSNFPPEDAEFGCPYVDDSAIHKYLDVKDDREIARLAAMMAPRPKEFNSEALLEAAIALNDGAKAALVRQREGMVAAMNPATIQELLQRLDVPPGTYKSDSDERFEDAIIGPVLRARRSMAEALNKLGPHANAGTAGDLTDADARTKIPRPALPCKFEKALRYATDSPKVRWQTLQKAFMDFLGVDWAAKEKRKFARRETSVRERIKRETERRAEIDTQRKESPATHASRKEQQKTLKKLEAELGALQSVINYPTCFKPGVKAPDEVANASTAIYTESWQNDKPVTDDKTLAWLSTEFHSFWKSHRDAYLKAHSTTKRATNARVAKNRVAASKGLASRERAKWLGHTGDFLAFLKDNPPPSPDISESINTFAYKHCNLLDKRACKKVRNFLGTLALYLDRDFDAAEILSPLRECGIKAPTEDAVRECLDLLKTGLGRGRGKKV